MKIKRLLIIPARLGSKRIKNKNIKKFCGKPIINWSIMTAKNFFTNSILKDQETPNILVSNRQRNTPTTTTRMPIIALQHSVSNPKAILLASGNRYVSRSIATQ